MESHIAQGRRGEEEADEGRIRQKKVASGRIWQPIEERGIASRPTWCYHVVSRGGELAVSLFTVAELVYGSKKSSAPESNYRALLEFLLPFTILPFKGDDCEPYGRVRSALEKAGQPIGTIDTFIGAQALSQNLILVTHNVGEFSRIEGLAWEDWTA